MTDSHPRNNQRLSNLFSLRYLRVLFFFGNVTLGFIWWHVILMNLGFKTLAKRGLQARFQSWAKRFRRLAVRMGGIWIKVGQFLSARVDVLPDAVTKELSGLQDEVPAEAFDSMYAVIEEEFEDQVYERFQSFDEEPLASASLGQVHRAKLLDGQEVVVKVQRPRIHELIRIDLAALSVVIGWLKRFKPVARRADLDALLSEFSRTLWEEVDYLAEAENARRFKQMFADDRTIRIPNVYSDQTTRRVLTLEDVYHIKITDYEVIKNAGIDLGGVAKRLFRTYLRQIFEEGFFHADPHPGNLFVEPLSDGDWRLIFVDFGMVGQLKPGVRKGMRDLAIAVATKDTQRLVDSYQTLGMILPGANLERIREAEAAVFDRFWGKSMRELTQLDMREMHDFARQYRDLLYELPFQVPSDLIFLGRCVAILSGMCTGLNPDFNFFKELMPFAEKLLMEEEEDTIGVILEWLEEQARLVASLPKRIDKILDTVERGELVVTTKPTPGLDQRLDRLTRGVNRLAAAVVFTALLVSGVLLYLNNELLLGASFMGLSVLTLWWVFRG
jgi:predicted unusual protein kinase regulating ubiquinone biosynthesis (AarF/ABC1/UbiB family)